MTKQEALDQLGINLDVMTEIKGTELHDYMVYADAFASCDGTELVFVETSDSDQQRFLYYMGAENDSQIEARLGPVTVWSVDPEYVERYLS
jgi:hypothetical protein